MSFQTFIFYFLSTVLVISALGVITARNPVHAALLLVLAFFTSSGLWLLLQAEFLAITLVLVYVGAVMVLFLFVVMMLDINIARLREGFWKYLPMGGVVALLLVVEMGMILTQTHRQAICSVPRLIRGGRINDHHDRIPKSRESPLIGQLVLTPRQAIGEHIAGIGIDFEVMNRMKKCPRCSQQRHSDDPSGVTR